MNERTHFFIKIYLSHFILERGCFFVCERWVGDGDRLLHIDPQVLLTIAALINRGSLRVHALCLELVLTPLASDLQLTQAVSVMVIFLFDIHLLPLIYTGASLDWQLGRGSICHHHTILIFQNSTCGIFLHIRLHSPHTHILQIMLKDNNSQKK